MTPAGNRILAALRGGDEELTLAREACRVLPADIRVRGAFVVFVWHIAKRMGTPEVVAELSPLVEPCLPSFFGMSNLGDGVAVTQLIANRIYPGCGLVEACDRLLYQMVVDYAEEAVFRAIAKVAENSYYEYLRCFSDFSGLIWTGRVDIAVERHAGRVSYEFPAAGAAAYFTPGFMRGMHQVLQTRGEVEMIRHDLDHCEIRASWNR